MNIALTCRVCGDSGEGSGYPKDVTHVETVCPACPDDGLPEVETKFNEGEPKDV